MPSTTHTVLFIAISRRIAVDFLLRVCFFFFLPLCLLGVQVDAVLLCQLHQELLHAIVSFHQIPYLSGELPCLCLDARESNTIPVSLTSACEEMCLCVCYSFCETLHAIPLQSLSGIMTQYILFFALQKLSHCVGDLYTIPLNHSPIQYAVFLFPQRAPQFESGPA